MFTGLVECIGTVTQRTRRGALTVIRIAPAVVFDDVRVGDSIAVNGVCLTVTQVSGTGLVFEVMPESVSRTTIGRIAVGSTVNLERSLKAGDRIGGHFVAGHVDCTSVLRRRFKERGNLCLEIACPAAYRKWLVPKGSIAVDGVSLTIGAILPAAFRVYVIPHTLDATTLAKKAASSVVNLEFDMLLKRLDKS